MKPPAFIHTLTPGKNPTSPTLLLLHGTGGNEESLQELGIELFPGATLLSPRGNVLEHGQPRFFRRLAEGVFDLDDLAARTTELQTFITESFATYQLNTRPIIAVGYSNGANIAVSLLLTYPSLLSGAILFRPLFPLEPSPLPNLNGIPILMLSGEQDTMASRDQTESLQTLLIDSNATVDFSWQPAGHNLTMSDVMRAKQWLAEHF